jgi:hypothetical protein
VHSSLYYLKAAFVIPELVIGNPGYLPTFLSSPERKVGKRNGAREKPKIPRPAALFLGIDELIPPSHMLRRDFEQHQFYFQKQTIVRGAFQRE